MIDFSNNIDELETAVAPVKPYYDLQWIMYSAFCFQKDEILCSSRNHGLLRQMKTLWIMDGQW